MEKASNALAKITQLVKTQPLQTFIAFCMILLLIMVVQNAQISRTVNSRIMGEPTAQQQADRFQRAIEFNSLINQSLQQLRIELKADRTLIRQFHNGKQDLTRLPFTYVQTTFVSLGPGVGITTQSLDSKPLATLNSSIRSMWRDVQQPVCISGYTQQNPDPAYKAYLQQNLVKYYIKCPMVNPKKYPIGFVAVGFKSQPQGNRQQLILKTRTLAKVVVGYLQQGVNNDRMDQEGLPKRI